MIGLTLLERYVFRKVMVSLIVATSALIGVLWVIRAIQRINVVLTNGQGLWTYLNMTILGVPTLSIAIIPIALLIAFARTINTLNSESELVVMHASGASRSSLIKPFLAAGLITAVSIYLLALFIGPLSMQTLRGHITSMRSDLFSFVIREGAFRDIGKGMTVHISSREQGGTMNGVFVLDGRNENETFTYIAQKGVISKLDGQSFLILNNGQIQRQSKGNSNVSVIKFQSYALNLTSFTSGKKSSGRSQMELNTYDLFYPDKEDVLYRHRPGRYRAEFHTRLTSGLYPIATVFIIAAFFGFPRSNRQGQIVAGITSSTIVVGLRMAGVAAEGALRSDASMIFVVWGLPILGIIIPLLIIISGKTIQLPQPIQARVDAFIQWVIANFERFRGRPASTAGDA